MSIPAFPKLIAYAGVYTSALPVLIGAIRFGARPVGERAIWMWMAVGLASNLFMMLAGGHTGNNTDLAELIRSVYLIAGLFALGELAESRKARNWVVFGVGVFLLWWVWRVINEDFTQKFGPWTGPVFNLIFTIAAVGLIWERIRMNELLHLRQFGLLIALGTIVSYAPGAALEALSFLLYNSNPGAVLVLWTARGILLLVGLVCFTLAFAWTIPRPSSAGSSPSGA